jgi:hypothetical protein
MLRPVYLICVKVMTDDGGLEEARPGPRCPSARSQCVSWPIADIFHVCLGEVQHDVGRNDYSTGRPNTLSYASREPSSHVWTNSALQAENPSLVGAGGQTRSIRDLLISINVPDDTRVL